MNATQLANLAVVVAYLIAIVGVGAYFALKKKSAEQFMVANQSLPGWAVGLSMFGSYISAISFLGNPAVAFKGNWMYAAFTLATPVGLLFGTLVFMRFYRRTRAISAYTHLEHRFGPWARTYAVFTFLILQMARQGTILYLLSQATIPLLGGDATNLAFTRSIVIGVGLLITFYTLFGGIEAVVWTGVLQSVVLLLGPIVCIAVLLLKIPGGLSHVIDVGVANHKFGLGPFDFSSVAPTFWIIVMSAILEHLRNWGVDQSYIQRYLATPTERDAAKSIWIAGLLYIPVGLFFFFIGTALFVYYQSVPDRLPAGLPPDSIFPRFIGYELPMGLGGLVIAAIFAASMDSNLNSMATLTLVDGYRRYLRPAAGERESMRVLYASTVFWGLMSIAWGLMMTLKGSQSTAEFAVSVGGLVAGGLLGLFLLGLISRRATSGIAAISVTIGVLIICWMTFSRMQLGGYAIWPERWNAFASPVHQSMAAFVGTTAIVLIGCTLGMLFGRPHEPATEADPEAGRPAAGAAIDAAER